MNEDRARDHGPGSDPYWKFRVENFPQTGLTSYLPVDGVEVKFLDGCNRSCIFCVNEDFAGKPLNPLDAKKFAQSLFAWIDDPHEPEKPAAVYGTGGEPLIALDLVEEVMAPLAARGVTTRLVTNGTLLNPQRLERLVRIGIAGLKVTFNSARDERLIALMRGHKGDARRILSSIRAAKEAGLWMFVRIGMGRHNADEVVEIYRMLAELGVDVVQIKPWIPSGLAATNSESLCLPPAQLRETFAAIAAELSEELSSKSGPEITVSCYPPARDLGFTVKDCANVAKIYCEPCGHALVCNFAGEHLGSWLPEEGGLSACVRRRRELYANLMDDHGVKSCPARLNWSRPDEVVSPADSVANLVQLGASRRRCDGRDTGLG